MMKYMLIVIFIIGCQDETFVPVEYSESDVFSEFYECEDFECEIVEVSYRCHKDILDLDIREMPTYEEEIKEQDSSCIQELYGVAEMVGDEEFDDLAVCWKWLDTIKNECEFSI